MPPTRAATASIIRKNALAGYTADTPVPYRISDVVAQISDRMGKLENRSSWTKYHRLITRIETLGNDSRYAFMFNSLFIEDMMVRVLSELFRLPIDGKPITVMQLAGFPAEVVDSVVSVVCRMAFDIGVWSDGGVPLLVCCEEAHRYAPADRKLGFGPTRKALSRIAKEGRKYGVFLGAVTQRPVELDPTILSQCSTVFAMRMANDSDQAIVKSAVPDAGSSLIEFLASLGTREAIAFGEGIALPMRFRFKDVPKEFLPKSQSGRQVQIHGTEASTSRFISSVVDRWREATTTTSRPRGGMASIDDALEQQSALGPRSSRERRGRVGGKAPSRAHAAFLFKMGCGGWGRRAGNAKMRCPSYGVIITAPPRAARAAGSSASPAPRTPSRHGRARNRRRGPCRGGASRPPASPRPRSTARARREKVVVASTSFDGVDMHVVLLGAVGEIADARHDRIVGPGDVDAVVDDVAGMGDPLAAAHELVVGRIAEGVAHAAVIAGEADAARARRVVRLVELLLLDLRHGVDRHDQAHVGDRRDRRRPRSCSRRRP